MKKLLIVLAASLVLSVSAFADYDSFCSGSIDTLVDGNSSFVLTSSDPSQPVYFWLEYNANQSQVYTNAISLVQNAPFTFTSSSSGNISNLTCNTLYGSVDGQSFYVWRTSAGGAVSRYTHNPELSPYASNAVASDICSDLLDFINSTPDSTSIQSSFSIPRGNVAYFQVAVAGDVNFTSYMSQLSFLIQFGENQYGPWGDTGQRYGPAAALPAAGTTFPLASQDPIRWFKDSKQNVLGQTKIGKSTKSCIVGQWYAFYNPDISQIAHEPTSDIAGASVTVQGSFSQVKVYPLSERLDYSGVGGTFSSYSDDDYASYYDGNIGEDGTITWTDQSGDLNAPSSGGQNAQYGDLSTEGLLETMRNTLNRIFEEIKSLFTFGYEAVQTLVGIFSDFVASLGQLYTWLPSEVYSALMSAVIVAIVIGVFKVFL